jgi:modification methylase
MITIYQGDCVDVMRNLPASSVNTIFADPPYNTGNTAKKTAQYDRNKDFEAKHWENFHADWDSIQDYYAFSRDWIFGAYDVLIDGGSIWLCGSFHNIPECAIALKEAGFYTIQWVAWCIPNAFPHLSGKKMANSNQTIIWARKGDHHCYNYKAARSYNDGKNLRDYWHSDVWFINNDCVSGKYWKHPSKKPPALVKRAIDISTPEHGIVLDPFGGSGTTCVASASLDLDCIVIEKHQPYIDMIESRLTVSSIAYRRGSYANL